MSSCGLPPLTLSNACGNGNCSFSPVYGRDVCSCESMWSGNSDFKVTTSQITCQIYEPAIIFLWAFLLVALYIATIVAVPKLMVLWEKHQTLVESSKKAGRTYRLIDNRGLASLLYNMPITLPLTTIIGAVKIAYPSTQHVGGDWGISVLWYLNRSAIYASVGVFQSSLLASLLKSQRTLDHIIHLNNKMHLIVFISYLIVQLIFLLPLIANVDQFNPIEGEVAVAFVFLHSAVASLIGLIQALYVRNSITRVLMESYNTNKDQKTLNIKEKLHSMQTTLMRQYFILMVLYGFFGVWPFMWNKHDYLLPVSWLTVAVIYMKVPKSLMQDQKSSNQNKKSSVTQDAPPGKNSNLGNKEAANSVGTGTLKSEKQSSAAGEVQLMTEKPPPTPVNPNTREVTFD